jgi:hypothetical protein
MLALFGLSGMGVNASASIYTKKGSDRLNSIVNAFHNHDSARIIGAKYLQHWPSEQDIDLLVSEVPSPPAGAEQLTDTGEVDYWQVITNNRVNDFENGRIAAIDGWLLSRTEARLCAIVALL